MKSWSHPRGSNRRPADYENHTCQVSCVDVYSFLHHVSAPCSSCETCDISRKHMRFGARADKIADKEWIAISGFRVLQKMHEQAAIGNCQRCV